MTICDNFKTVQDGRLSQQLVPLTNYITALMQKAYITRYHRYSFNLLTKKSNQIETSYKLRKYD